MFEGTRYLLIGLNSRLKTLNKQNRLVEAAAETEGTI
jgi:hypothetical protein